MANVNYIQQQDKVINPQLLLLSVVELGKQRGVHPDKLLKNTALFYDDIKRLTQAISQKQWVALVANCHKLLKHKDFSFLLGSRLFPANLGHLGNALLHCRHLADMLRLVKCYQMHVCPWLFLSNESDENHSYLWLTPAISVEHQQYDEFMFELFATAIVTAMKWRLGTTTPMSEPTQLSIRFPFPQPRHIEQYQSFLPCHYQFASSKIGNALQIRISHDLLYQRFAQSNLSLKRYYRQQLTKPHVMPGLLQFLQYNFELQNKQNRAITLESTALNMDISVATLKRKLSAHNSSFQQVYDHYRQQKAIYRLTELGLSNESVATQMNFSDLTNFRRAIKRWTGLTPSALKRSLLF